MAYLDKANYEDAKRKINLIEDIKFLHRLQSALQERINQLDKPKDGKNISTEQLGDNPDL